MTLSSPRAYFETLGCPKNETDSNDMSKKLTNSGYLIAQTLEDADIVFVNTCSFIKSATEESIDTILDILESESVSLRDVPVVVCGCMPSRYGKDLAPEFSEVAAFLPCDSEGSVVDVADSCLKLIRDESGSISSWNRKVFIEDDLGVETTFISDEAVFAYVKISDGCSRCCAYCTIPMIRGPYRSFTYDEIYETVLEHVNNGVKEIVLIGQDTGIWGKDFEKKETLANLLSRLSAQFPDTWFRIMYTQPESVTDELLSVISKNENICSYLDIPMQHCSESVLSSMGRQANRQSLLSLVSKIRTTLPNAAIRTTLMTGFPGESENDFNELMDFVSEARLDYVGVFAFSPEEGTRAANMPNQIDEDERLWRAEQIRSLADSISADVISQRCDKSFKVLVEGIEEDGQLFGRVQAQAPEVDGLTFVNHGEISRIYDCVIEDTLMYDMEAKVCV